MRNDVRTWSSVCLALVLAAFAACVACVAVVVWRVG